jgi:hypothetical protein
MGLADVVALANSGVSDEVILNQMRTTGANFALGTQDLIFLKKTKVSDAVVMVMQNSRLSPVNPAPMMPAAQPYYYHPPYPAMMPYPAPPVSVAPIPAYAPPPPPSVYVPPSQCVPAPGGPNCLPVPVRGMSISPASYSVPLPAPAQNEGAAAVGEMLIEAAVELIDGFGELFGAD